jgi:SAM-dependent methyltransferase
VSDSRAGEVQAFFGPRAAGWNERFAADGPAFARAVADVAIAPGSIVLDVGCGAGRALTDLSAAVGPSGAVIGVDLTYEMLAAARAQVPDAARLVLGDAQQLPVRDGVSDVIFAAGLVHHLASRVLGLAELGRVARDGARLAVFHPIGRATLAAKHGRPVRPDDPLDPAHLQPLLDAGGWRLDSVDDGPDRYLALATRVAPTRVIP